MPRVKRGSRRRDRRKKILAQAKGYYQRKSKLFRYAKEAVERGQKFAYIGRRLKKRDFRSLWIIRIGAAARGPWALLQPVPARTEACGHRFESQDACRYGDS